MATYSAAYPALPPLISGDFDAAAPAIAQGDALDDQNVINAELQYKSRKLSQKLGRATVQELMDAKKRKIQIEMENCSNGNAAIPVWAANIQQQLNQLNQNLQQTQNQLNQNLQQSQNQLNQNLQQTQNQLNQSLQQMEQRITNRLMKEEARNMNRFSIRQNTDAIIRVPNDNGDHPPPGVWFPKHTRSLLQAQGVKKLNPLLVFYGLDANGIDEQKRERLRIFLGIPL